MPDDDPGRPAAPLAARLATPVLAALVRVALPPTPELAVPVDPADLRRRASRTFGGLPPAVRAGLVASLLAFDLLAVLRFGRRFRRLGPARAERWARAWLDAPLHAIRQVAKLWFVVAKPLHVARPEVRRALGYPVDRLAAARPVREVTLDPARHAHGLGAGFAASGRVRCEVVVVGTGAGGAVVAAELARRGVDVVMVERGRWFPPEELGRDPMGVMSEAYADAGATFALGRPGILVPFGRTVGGTTTINSGTCFRLPAAVRERWRELGLPVEDAELDALYAEVERRISVRPTPEEHIGGSSRVVARGAERLGLHFGPLLRNVDGCGGSAVCAFGCPRNAKLSANLTWVPDALAAGARLLSGVEVRRVRRRGGRAVGVAGRDAAGRRVEIRAERVVIAGGTVGSVPLLRAAGVRSPHLGRHLTIHPASKILARLPEPVEGWRDTPQGTCIDDLAAEGVMFEGSFVPPEPTALALPLVGEAMTRALADYRHLALFGFLVSDHPNRWGRVRVLPGGRPVMTYVLGERETELVRRALLLLAEVFLAAGAERLFMPLAGAEVLDDLDGVRAALAPPLDPWRLELAAFHPLGTARMAARRDDGVVDPELRCWEVPGLHVVDGSVFPSSLGVNPQLTIMAFALGAARRLAAGLGHP